MLFIMFIIDYIFHHNVTAIVTHVRLLAVALLLKFTDSECVASYFGYVNLLYSVEILTGIKFITCTWAISVKNPETGRFLFFLAYISVYMGFAYLLPKVRNDS
jgi:hypothetical protein